MPQCCAVPKCANKTGGHKFPLRDKIRLNQWLVAIRRSKYTPTKNSLVCKSHFTADDYELPKDSVLAKPRPVLKKNAVPSKFSWNEPTSHLPGRQQISRHLKIGVVPSIFPWTKKSSPATSDATQKQKASSTSTKNNESKKNTVSPQNAPKKEESNSSEINNVLRNKSMRLKNRKAYLLNRRCSVPHCNARPTNEISLHPCPNNAAVRNEWAEALRVSYQYVKNMVACSLHFSKIDFIQSKNSERVLKHNAVPSRNLQNRKMVPVKHKALRKDRPSKPFERQQTMTDTVDETKEAIQEEGTRECRACLIKLDDKKSCCNVFQAWAPPWDGMEATIAEDLAKLANVEISLTDRHSKVLCMPCYQRLLDAAIFASSVRNCDLLLRMRFTAEIDMEKVWPKPIQVDKNINGSVFDNQMDIEIKQEVLSDEEYPVNGSDNPYVETELANLDIKIEPEELVEPPLMNITINGTISLDPLNSENKDVKNGAEIHQGLQFSVMEVKQEPTSDGEQDNEPTPDLSLDCLLCAKSFNSVSGLKAHVIAQHSYKTVKRKAHGSVSPEKKRRDQHQCAICKRSFKTSTDLMVHETCHNKHACYGCTEKFDSFELLTRHRKRCKANIGNSVQKLKTLEDVKRPLPEEKVGYLEVPIENIGTETPCQVEEDIVKKETEIIKEEDIEMKDINSEHKEESSKNNQVESVIEGLENVNKALESVNKELESDTKLESLNEVKNDKKSESMNEELKIDEKSGSVDEDEVKNDMETESMINVNNDEKSESINEEKNNEKISESRSESVENDKNLESAEIEAIPIDNNNAEIREEDLETEKKIECENKEVVEDPDGNMKLHLEIHSTDKETESVPSDADMPEETVDNDHCS